MRHGESNGRVKVEESNFVRRDEALQAVYIDFPNGEYRRRYPACYLYNASVRQYVKIQYNSLIHYMSLMVEDEAEYLCVRVERCIYSGNPKVIYVR